MITLIDVIRALSGIVERVFGEPPTTKDITEGFTRPCTYIQPGKVVSSKEGELRHDIIPIDIIRFAESTHEGWIGLLKAQSALTSELEGYIKVSEDFYLYPEDVEFDLRRDEMTLIASVYIENYQIIADAEENNNYMENLEIKKGMI